MKWLFFLCISYFEGNKTLVVSISLFSGKQETQCKKQMDKLSS